VFEPHKNTSVFFGIAKSAPWNEEGELKEDEVCNLKDKQTAPDVSC